MPNNQETSDNVAQLSLATQKREEQFDPDSSSAIQPIIEVLEQWIVQSNVVFDPAGGIFSTVNMNTAEKMSLKPVQVMRRIKYAFDYPKSLPSEPERILAAIEIYTERQREMALRALQKRLRIDPQAKDGRAQGHSDLGPLIYLFETALPELAKDKKALMSTVYSMAHIMQNVKRKVGGKKDRDVMGALLWSPVQGTGKTEFWRKFCKPIAPFYFEDSFANLFEKFGFMPWTLYYVLCADEMAIAKKDQAVEISEVKRRMSEEIISNRGMQTELNIKHPRRATVVGNCNKHPREIVGDEKGRRFVPIYFGDTPYKQGQHNAIDNVTAAMFNDAWRCIDELIPSYAAPHREEIQLMQSREMRRKDWVDEALDEILEPLPEDDKDRFMLQSEIKSALRDYRTENGITLRLPGRDALQERLIQREVKANRDHPKRDWVVWGYKLAESAIR